MSRLDLSLCMIIKNEELHLERCLSSVEGIVSEIIIADTGSQDYSLNIAKRYGARIIRVPWEHDFAKARNATLKEARRSWILVLDADEELDGWRLEEISILLRDRKANGYFLQLVSYLTGPPDKEYVTDSVCRLFRNNSNIQFRGKIHEEVSQSIQEMAGSSVYFSNLRINHYGYLQQEIIRKNKNNRNFLIIKQAIEEKPDDPMLQYALGTEYFQIEQYDKAVERFLPLLEKMPADSGYVSDLYLKASYALRMLQRHDEAVRLLEQGLALFPDFTGLYEAKASLLLESRDYNRAYEALLQALKIGDVSNKYTSISGSGTYRTRTMAGYVCEQRWLFQEALEHYWQAVNIKPGYLPVWSKFVSSCLLAGRQRRLAVYLGKYANDLTPHHLSLLIPALLNAGAAECLKSLLALPFPDDQGLILRALYHWLRHDQAEAVRILVRSESDRPGSGMPLSYLWAMAWAQADAAAARVCLEKMANQTSSSLSEVHKLLEGETEARLNESDLLNAVQLLVQVGAWEAILDIYRFSGENLQWNRMPQSLLCGLLKAPASVQRRWIGYFMETLRPSRSTDLVEAVFFTVMAQACGEDLPAALVNGVLHCHQHHPAAKVVTAYQYLEKARRLSPQLNAGTMQYELLLGACME